MTDEQCRLVTDNMRLAPYIFHRYFSRTNVTNLNYEDLVSASYVGLCKAAIHYDSTKNIKFATYASRVIYNEVGMELRRLNPFHTNTIPFETELIDLDNSNATTYHDILAANNSDPVDIAQWNDSLTALQEKLKPKYHKFINYGCKVTTKMKSPVRQTFHKHKSLDYL